MITILTELNNGTKIINQNTQMDNKYHFQVENLFIPSNVIKSLEWLSSDLVIFEVSHCKNVYNVKNGNQGGFKRVTYAIWMNEFDRARDGLKYVNKISKTGLKSTSAFGFDEIERFSSACSRPATVPQAAAI